MPEEKLEDLKAFVSLVCLAWCLLTSLGECFVQSIQVWLCDCAVLYTYIYIYISHIYNKGC